MSAPPGVKLTGDWDKARAVFNNVSRGAFKRALGVALHREGLFLAGKIVEKLHSGDFQPLSRLTMAARALAGFGGSKPLNVSGALAGAVTVHPNSPTSLTKFIGILRTARRKGGQGRGAGGRFTAGAGSNLANLGDIHENGRDFIVKMTDKMRKYLFGVLFPAAGIDTHGGGGSHSTGYITVHIPPRPFVGPVFRQWTPTTPERIMADVGRLLHGQLGST